MIRKTGPQLLTLRKTLARFFLPVAILFIMLALGLLAAGALAGCTSIEAVRLTLTPPSPTDTPAPVVAAATAPATATVAATGEATTTSRVFFQQPSDNAIVPLTSTVIMSATGLTIEPAGEIHEGAGHFHILVDTDFVPAGEVIPNDEQHLHFGQAQLETEVGLTPGSHMLRLQFADGAHTALEGDEYRHEIVVGAVEGAPEQAVRFVTPTDGATVPPITTVRMAATDLTVEPAGEVREGAGHFHVLIDADFIPAGEVIPNDELHLHFGQAQLETEVGLTPGEHVLRLQFADGAHTALEGDEYRDEITINVVEDAPAEQVMLVEPADGDTVASPFTVKMAAAGLMVEPAGQVIREGAGHFHILVNEDFLPAGEVIPNDETHLHFGKAQLETELTLEPGDYILRLQLANGAHQALEGDQYQDEIEITVE